MVEVEVATRKSLNDGRPTLGVSAESLIALGRVDGPSPAPVDGRTPSRGGDVLRG